MQKSVVIRAMLTGGDGSSSGLPPDLLRVDRILQRWAVSVGSGLPTEVWDDTLVARPPPLDDECAVLVDRVVVGLPRRGRKLVDLWYRKPGVPGKMIAKRLNCSEDGLDTVFRAVLGETRKRLIVLENRTLIGLLSSG